MKEMVKPLKFVVLLGIVSLLADVTYEGARSVTGPCLALLGASGAVVGAVAGAGELVGGHDGTAPRSVVPWSAWVSDGQLARTQ